MGLEKWGIFAWVKTKEMVKPLGKTWLCEKSHVANVGSLRLKSAENLGNMRMASQRQGKTQI